MTHGQNLVIGGKNIYGYPIGVLMLDTDFPRIPGDIGNASTFNFPILYKVVKGASVDKVVDKLDISLLKPFIDATKELVEEGVSAITTSCGFLAIFQKELALEVKVPVFTSSLLMVPIVHRMLQPNQKIGILTANSLKLTDRHLKSVGIDNIPYVCRGFQDKEHFSKVILNNNKEMDTSILEKEFRDVSLDFIKTNPDLGAIVLECTNMPPYSKIIRECTGIPVFDIITLINFMYNSIVKQEYTGVM